MNTPCLQASAWDYHELLGFLNGNHLSFRHLDWISPIERLNDPYTFINVEGGVLQAVINTSPENEQCAWLRFFECVRDGSHKDKFHQLLACSEEALRAQNIPTLFAMSVRDWVNALLIEAGFKECNHLVTLRLKPPLPKTEPIPNDLVIRQMTARDLNAVLALDHAAFRPEWQLNKESLRETYQLSANASVALLKGEMAGYQLSTLAFQTSHLGRLAVSPALQGHGIGKHLVLRALQELEEIGAEDFSVNTQQDNPHSFRLYHSLGYQESEDTIPVFRKQLFP